MNIEAFFPIKTRQSRRQRPMTELVFSQFPDLLNTLGNLLAIPQKHALCLVCFPSKFLSVPLVYPRGNMRNRLLQIRHDVQICSVFGSLEPKSVSQSLIICDD